MMLDFTEFSGIFITPPPKHNKVGKDRKDWWVHLLVRRGDGIPFTLENE